jgi:predicted PurR-regulated permease PerM
VRVEAPQRDAAAPHDLSELLMTPRWLRETGTTAWMAVGLTLLAAGVIWLLSLTHTIVMPVIAAFVVAAVTSPVVAGLERRRVPRIVGAALVLVGGLAAALGMVYAIVRGVDDQAGVLTAQLDGAKAALRDGLADLGVSADTARATVDDASRSLASAVPALLDGVAGGLAALSGLVVFLSLTALSLVFLLKDGPQIRAWTERQMRVPGPIAHQITGRVLESLRGYFFGVTIVAAFNAVVVGGGALLLGVPLPGTIAIVTFAGAYIPYLGAWSAGAFAVLVALGGAGTDAAVAMAVIALLANGLLQQLVQPIAYGAALGIHPLAVLIVTIAGGALFGAAGLILAAPMTAAAAKIASDLAAVRAPAP